MKKNLDNYKELKLKLLLKQRALSNYSDNYLIELENEVYEHISDIDKVKYEVLALDDDLPTNNYYEKFAYRKIIDRLIEFISEGDIDIELLKKLISTLQIIDNKDYAFYTSIKSMDDDYFSYILEILKNKEEKKKVNKK